MTERPPAKNLRLTSTVAEQRIHHLAEDTSRVALTTHAKDRMAERDISVRDVYTVLRRGQIMDPPVKAERGEWKCKITLKLKGRRIAGVVLALRPDDKMIIVTVEWEDTT